MADFCLEENLIKRGYANIAGIDEAGRGALFGPVVAASVMFSKDFIRDNKEDWVFEIDDSKRLTPKKREKLAKAILASAQSVGIGMATNREIDKNNIREASFEAMRRSVDNMADFPDYLLVDGFQLPLIKCEQTGLQQGDQKSISIAAASIVAKVLRDQMVTTLDTVYDGYSLARHKGYGTRDHLQAIEEKGPTIFHRTSFRPFNQDSG